MEKSLLLNRVVIVLAMVAAVLSGQDYVSVGMGSYKKSMPGNVPGPQKEIYKTGKITGPIPTTDWCSSLYWEKYSSNHFALPLAMCAGEKGLGISYPGGNIHAVDNHFFGSYIDEFVLGHSGEARFPDARVDGYSDWFVDVLFERDGSSMRLSYGHGSPYVYAIYKNGGARLTFREGYRVWSGNENSAVLGITHMGKHWALFGPAGSTWSGLGTNELVNNNGGKDYFSLALLPEPSEQALRMFGRYAYAHVTGTKVLWEYDQQSRMVKTSYAVETKSYQGDGEGTIMALYPHQWQFCGDRALPFMYNSVRGPMKAVAGKGFSTGMRFPGVLPFMPMTGGCSFGILNDYVLKAADHNFADPPDTYWAGKQLGMLSNIIPVAEMAGQKLPAEKFFGNLKGRLEDWFDASRVSKSVHYFAYEDNWKSLIGVAPSYGTNDQLNDHHFHYGYFIRAAAEIARTDRNWCRDDQWGAMVDMLIRDIASGDRADDQFPFLRCFDPYEGHSWASGHAKFGDGNNQESSSEAMNAWTGIILWAMATGNTELRDLGIYLYTTEMNAINSYWFDINDNLFPAGYRQQTAAIVWGGKVDFATWFSAKPEHIVGINLLPIQSGSLYLGLYPEYVRRNLLGLYSLNGGGYSDWQETFLMYESLASGQSAMQKFNAGLLRDKDPVAQAYAYHWISNMDYLGNVNRNIGADYPCAMTFTKGNINSYMVCNYEPNEITVRFSNGKTVKVKANDIFVGH